MTTTTAAAVVGINDDKNCSKTKEDCEVACGGAENATFTDYAALGTAGSDDEKFIIRTQTCICGPHDPSKEFCFECDICQQSAKVWDTNDYTSSCSSFSPFSLATQDRCRLFCSEIDPLSYAYGPGYCKCAGEFVCGSGGGRTAAIDRSIILPTALLFLSIYFLFTLY